MKKRLILGAVSTFLVSTLISTVGVGESKAESKPISADFSVSYSPYYYKWSEKAGIDEKGWVHALKVSGKMHVSKIIWIPYIEPSFKIYGGEVKYDGQAWTGEAVKTKTNYNGWEAELNLGYTYAFDKNFKVSLYGGIGREYWKRDLENAIVDNTLAIGYSEKWRQNYVKIGVKPEYGIGNYYVFGNFYAKYPWKVKESASLFDVEVEPGKKLNYGAELGVGVKGFLKKDLGIFASVFYERDKFGKSDEDYSEVVGGYLYQPESKRETYGFRIGINF